MSLDVAHRILCAENQLPSTALNPQKDLADLQIGNMREKLDVVFVVLRNEIDI